MKEIGNATNEKTSNTALDDVHNRELNKLIEYYTFNIKSKPNYVKDYLFTNELIKPVTPRVCQPYSIPVSMIDTAKDKISEMVDFLTCK